MMNIIVLLVCTFSVQHVNSGSLDREVLLDQQMKRFLRDYHNELRSQIASGRFGQPKAADMEKLVWSDEIAKKSQDWANKCDWHHRSSDNNHISNICGTASFSYLGENLAAGSMFERDWPSLDQLVYGVINQSMQGWFSEYKYFTFPGGCRSSQQCGHYTQLIWADTSHVGCGISSCKSIDGLPFFGLSYFLVCNYGPGGNIIINGEGIAPYKIGAPCSECASDKPSCTNSLCSGHAELPCEDARNYLVCTQFKLRGYCKMCSQYFWQMNQECNSTCGFCKLQFKHGDGDLGDDDDGWPNLNRGTTYTYTMIHLLMIIFAQNVSQLL